MMETKIEKELEEKEIKIDSEIENDGRVKEISDEKKDAPEEKVKAVNEIANAIKNGKTLMLVNIKGLPSKQFQAIKKSIREHANVKVSKKNIMLRAIKKVGKESIIPLNELIHENIAFVISDLDGFELAGILSQKKNPVFAKSGQIAPNEIEVKSGPTDLVPGPAISELGALGIQIAVEDGKISIKQNKIVARTGQEITAGVASLLQKLNIQPFTIGLEPIAVYDVESGKIFKDIKIDPESTADEIKNAAGKALGFAQKIVYYCKETIGYLLAKANAEGHKLNDLNTGNVTQESSTDSDEKKYETEEKPSEEKKEETEEKSEEDNAQLNEPEEKA